VVEVIGPDQVLAISGNDHNAVRTRIRSTTGVIGWRDVTDIAITTYAGPLKKQQDEGAAKESNTANIQESSEHLGSALDGLAW
jgi:hypothetical protein